MSHHTPHAQSLSYWERASLIGTPDVVIIGCGIVGLTAALHLKKLDHSLQILIIEKGALPAGASTRNAGFACFGSISELLDDMSQRSEEEVWTLVERRWRGLQRLREIVGDTALHYEPLGGYEVFRADDVELFEDCANHIAAFNRKLAHLTGLRETYEIADDHIERFGFKGVKHLIINQGEGQIHTGRMMSALLDKAAAAGIRMLFGTPITEIDSGSRHVILHTQQGWEIKTHKVLVATNGFAQRLLPYLDVQPARNQVLITQPIPGLQLRGSFHYDRGYYYFRNIDGRILLGGGRHLDKSGETTDELGTTSLIRDALLHLLKEMILPGRPHHIDTWWSGIMGVGPQKNPILQMVDNHVAVAVRLGGMGVAIGSLLGEQAADLILSWSNR